MSAKVQADAFGIPIDAMLRVQSSQMRTKRRHRAEEKAQKVPVKALFHRCSASSRACSSP